MNARLFSDDFFNHRIGGKQIIKISEDISTFKI